MLAQEYLIFPIFESVSITSVSLLQNPAFIFIKCHRENHCLHDSDFGTGDPHLMTSHSAAIATYDSAE